jgi:hypothetical protein
MVRRPRSGRLEPSFEIAAAVEGGFLAGYDGAMFASGKSAKAMR